MRACAVPDAAARAVKQAHLLNDVLVRVSDDVRTLEAQVAAGQIERARDKLPNVLVDAGGALDPSAADARHLDRRQD